MDIKELHAAWDVDKQIYITQLLSQTANIGSLHHKYWQHLLAVREEVRQADNSYAKLRLAKYNLYDQGPSKEMKTKYEWVNKSPKKGAAVTRKELDIYLDADEELQKEKEVVQKAKDKMDFLEDILEMIKKRDYHLKLIFDIEKFRNGE